MHRKQKRCCSVRAMASGGSTGHRCRNLWPDRHESPGHPGGSGHRSRSRDREKSLLRVGYARLLPCSMVRKGSSVRVRQRAFPAIRRFLKPGLGADCGACASTSRPKLACREGVLSPKFPHLAGTARRLITSSRCGWLITSLRAYVQPRSYARGCFWSESSSEGAGDAVAAFTLCSVRAPG